MNIPAGCHSVLEALTKFVSLTGPLSKKAVKEFAPFCESQQEKDELLGMTGMGKQFEEKIVAKNIGLLDLVESYASLKIPFDVLI